MHILKRAEVHAVGPSQPPWLGWDAPPEPGQGRHEQSGETARRRRCDWSHLVVTQQHVGHPLAHGVGPAAVRAEEVAFLQVDVEHQRVDRPQEPGIALSACRDLLGEGSHAKLRKRGRGIRETGDGSREWPAGGKETLERRPRRCRGKRHRLGGGPCAAAAGGSGGLTSAAVLRRAAQSSRGRMLLATPSSNGEATCLRPPASGTTCKCGHKATSAQAGAVACVARRARAARGGACAMKHLVPKLPHLERVAQKPTVRRRSGVHARLRVGVTARTTKPSCWECNAQAAGRTFAWPPRSRRPKRYRLAPARAHLDLAGQQVLGHKPHRDASSGPRTRGWPVLAEDRNSASWGCGSARRCSVLAGTQAA